MAEHQPIPTDAAELHPLDTATLGTDLPSPKVRLLTLAQWGAGGGWRLSLPHSSKTHNLLWITKGQARITLEGVQRGLGAHNAVVIPAGSGFALEPGAQCFGWVVSVAAQSPILMPDNAQILRILEVQNQTELTALIDRMQRETHHNLPFADEALAAHAQLMTVWLRRAMIDHDNTARPKASQRLVTAYAALIERDYHLPRVMADYAADLGVTPTHLTRTCRQSAGMTAADMLVRRKLHAARVALEDGDLPITQIAASLGFGSAAYFSRFIQHHTTHSPSSLRKAARAA
ncbi:AraC family transcriptional regulator [Roseovarius nubinhibens]|jgi:AraC family transcriptional activator of pobA|uniref:Transcriptional regulator, AraC family protein n=1 Tax=Roseovarius nubinhibens (strain ATCC BAA-591 / DSM 15170 / ISM) TaxID=89187 RepID=A3SNZ4_ROSNI|nr:AraC family transcriptional regulator [Roseovarius nubinhibens]EAP76184.1 transcriptional regulator, AraC family protein [Roseovarius nubinhibens ISM]